MVLNPMAFATPQEREQLAKVQQLTRNIKYVLHTEENRVEITLETDDPRAEELIAQLQEGIVGSVTQMLYQMLDMKGERI